MSKGRSDPKFELQHIVIAVRDVITEWYGLGLQLGLPEHILRPIGSDPNAEGRLRMMLSKWLDYDPEASWDKLANALNTMGKNAIAAKIRSKYIGKLVGASTHSNSTSKEMAQTILQKIKGQFASLLIEVRSAMEEHQVKMVDVHQFLVTFFQGDSYIPEVSDLAKLFNVITEAKLWCYDHYGPLKELAKHFLPDSHPACRRVDEYRSRLSGFYTTTKIIEFINLSEFEETVGEDSHQSTFNPEDYKMYYRKLTVTLKLDRKVKLSDMTLDYVNSLWNALVEEFNLPPLTAVIEKIVKGSLKITWLILPHIARKIATVGRSLKAIKFYQHYNIAQVAIDDNDSATILYNEQWFNKGATPLYQACFVGNTDDALELLSNGGDIDEQNKDELGRTALSAACQQGYVNIVQLLINNGANVNFQQEDGRTGLMWASDEGHSNVVKVLLDAKADPNIANEDGWTAIFFAVRHGRTDIIKLLVNYGAAVDIRNKDGDALFIEACYYGKVEVVCALLRAGATVDIQDQVWKLIKNLSDFNSCIVACHINDAQDGSTGLMWACRNGHLDIVQILLEAKADPNIADEDGQAALYFAVSEGHADVIEMLINYGAAVAVTDISIVF